MQTITRHWQSKYCDLQPAQCINRQKVKLLIKCWKNTIWNHLPNFILGQAHVFLTAYNDTFKYILGQEIWAAAGSSLCPLFPLRYCSSDCYYICLYLLWLRPSPGLVSEPSGQDEAAAEAAGPARGSLRKQRQWRHGWESVWRPQTAVGGLWWRALRQAAGRRGELPMDTKQHSVCTERDPEVGDVGEAGGAELRGAPLVQHRGPEGQSPRARGRDPQHRKDVSGRRTNTGSCCCAQWLICFLLPVCPDNFKKLSKKGKKNCLYTTQIKGFLI